MESLVPQMMGCLHRWQRLPGRHGSPVQIFIAHHKTERSCKLDAIGLVQLPEECSCLVRELQQWGWAKLDAAYGVSGERAPRLPMPVPDRSLTGLTCMQTGHSEAAKAGP